jgi:hypothetical protein
MQLTLILDSRLVFVPETEFPLTIYTAYIYRLETKNIQKNIIYQIDNTIKTDVSPICVLIKVTSYCAILGMISIRLVFVPAGGGETIGLHNYLFGKGIANN